MKILHISIGDELTQGEIADTNAAWTSALLFSEGFQINKIIAIPDETEIIVDLLKQVSLKADLAICCGGLGPTADDLTSKAVTNFLGCPLVEHEEGLKKIEALFKKRGFLLTENNRQQAMVPKVAKPLLNRVGLASGYFFKKEKCTFFFFPGVPEEYKDFVSNTILPFLSTNYSTSKFLQKKELVKCIGIPESHLDEKVKPFIKAQNKVKAAFRAVYPENWLKLLWEEDGLEYEEVRENILQSLGSVVYGFNNDTLPQVIGSILKKFGKTLSVAESCTGGQLGYYITEISGSSQYFKGGALTYSNELKVQLLGVSEETLNKYGAVSEECCREMAEGAKNRFKTDFALSITGIAGPDGGTKEKPVGLVYIGLSTEKDSIVKQLFLRPPRASIRHASALCALDLLRIHLINNLSFSN